MTTLHRLFRIVVSFAIVCGAYLLYALLVVPWTHTAVAPVPEATEHATPSSHTLPTPLQHFRAYFKDDDWELQDPIFVENSQFALLLRDYESLPGGQVKISPCTILFFPDGQGAGDASRALLLRAPEGAILNFDKDCDLSRAKIGRLKGGRLLGEVTIRGHVGATGDAGTPGDELRIATRDVELRSDRIWTPHAVRFQMGRNRGQGREMLIALQDEGTSDESPDAPPVQSIQSFQLLHDVRLYLELDSGGFLPGKKSPPRTAASKAAPEPPVEVLCDGAFRFDIPSMTANFHDRVRVIRINPTGPSDQLNAERLTIHFAQVAKQAKTSGGKAKPKQGLSKTLTATRIEATGHPVTVRSPSVQGETRSEFLRFDLQDHQLHLGGREPVQLRYEEGQIEARQVRYVAGPEGQLGEIWAQGPGKLTARLPKDSHRTQGNHHRATNAAKDDVVTARWKGLLQVRPNEGKHVLSLEQGAHVQHSSAGALAADELWLWLLPAPEATESTKRPADARSKRTSPLGGFTPHSILALGNVTLDATPLSANTDRLEVWFQKLPTAPATGRSVAPVNQPITHRSQPAASQRSEPKTTDRYHLHGDLIQVGVGLPAEGDPVLTNATVSGDVRVTQRPTEANDEGPLSVSGQHLEIRKADTPQAVVRITGQPARAAGRGMALEGPAIHLDKATNRAWVDGAGRMTLPMDRDLQGKQLTTPEPLHVDWNQQMVFDGQTVRFGHQVTAHTRQQRLQTGTMAVTLNQRIDFDRPRLPNADGSKIGLAKIACTGGVTIESSTVERGQQTSAERMEVRDLSVNQISGAIRATGPGWVSTVRQGSIGDKDSPLAAPGTQKGLVFTKIHFQSGITGNLHDKELFFNDQIRCIYGPVANWTDRLDPDKTGGPTGDEILLTCDRLALRQMGTGRSGSHSIEMEALENAQVEGETFTARGHRLAYATAKELLVLEGNGHTDAELSRQAQVGGPVARAAAQKILYWRATNRIEVQGVRFGSGTFPAKKP